MFLKYKFRGAALKGQRANFLCKQLQHVPKFRTR